MIKNEDLIEQAKQAEEDILNGKHKDKENNKFPLILLGMLLSGLIVAMIIPVYSIKIDPNPEMIDKIEFNGSYSEEQRMKSIYDIKNYPLSPLMRNAAVEIISKSDCKGSRTCYAKALYYYVRDNYDYISDPKYEYVQSPEETLLSGGGDCEDKALLLSELLTAVGIHNRIVLVPKHAYNQIWIEDARESYKDKIGWINLDSTCSICRFSEIPKEYRNKDYVE